MRKNNRVFSRSGLCLLLCLCVSYLSFAQNTRTISGTVMDDKQQPLSGVSVVLKDSKLGAATDKNGHYTLRNVPDGATLIFSYTGYTNQEIKVEARMSIDVILTATSTDLNEVVVIGYGTARKKDVTGSVSSISATRLENENPASVQDVLRANVPGLNVGTTTTAKGGGSLLVRGPTSLNAGTSPLIVLNGVIYPGQLSDINPNDISSIDVLKDASSAAVFGAKSASGVIIITTKKGSGKKPVITFNSNFGVAELAKNQPLYDGPGFVQWRRDVQRSRNVNSNKLFIFEDPRNLPDTVTMSQWRDGRSGDSIDIWLDRLGLKPIEITNYKAGKTTDWYSMMFQKAFRQDHTISLSGKGDAVTYYMSAGYTDNKGVVVGDRFKTARIRLDLEAKVANWMTPGMSVQFADRDESSVPVNWGQMINASPYGERYNDDGVTLRDSPNDDLGNNSNPFLGPQYTNRLQKTNTIFGTLFLKGALPYGFSYQVNFTPNFEFYRYFNGVSANHPTYRVRKGIATRTTQTTYYWQLDNLLKWNKSFGDHDFDVTFLVNAEKFQNWREQMDNEGFDPNDVLSYHNIGSGIKPIISSDDQVTTGDALMGRLNYTFKDKYLLTASWRRDGYSGFGASQRRAAFPAIALAWDFSRETFAKDASWLSFGKLRASWGVNGNRDIRNSSGGVERYFSIPNLTTGKYQFIGPDGSIITVSQLWVNRMQNDNLRWEQTTSYNLGVDFGFLNNKISGSIDVYKKVTKDVLVLRSLPNVTGFDNIMFNLGNVDNRGIDITLNTQNITKENFSWRTSANFWLNRNKIKALYGPVNVYDASGNIVGQVEKDDTTNRWFIGHDMNAVWDQKVLGVWQISERAEASKYGVAPGDFKVQDLNGDGKYSNADRQFLGYTTPRFQWTLRNEFTIRKRFDFSFMLYSNWGHLRSYNQAKNNSGFQDRQNSYVQPYWTAENPINDYARMYSSNGSATYSVYRKASFIRLSTVALGYNFPTQLVNKWGFQSLKLFANVSNLAVFAPDWEFWDPEYGNSADADQNYANSPAPRVYSLGINLVL